MNLDLEWCGLDDRLEDWELRELAERDDRDGVIDRLAQHADLVPDYDLAQNYRRRG